MTRSRLIRQLGQVQRECGETPGQDAQTFTGRRVIPQAKGLGKAVACRRKTCRRWPPSELAPPCPHQAESKGRIDRSADALTSTCALDTSARAVALVARACLPLRPAPTPSAICEVGPASGSIGSAKRIRYALWLAREGSLVACKRNAQAPLPSDSGPCLAGSAHRGRGSPPAANGPKGHFKGYG